jgi:serine/threonine-protein kinase
MGSTLGGYRIEWLIRHDIGSTLYLATHLRSKRKVALKVLPTEATDDRERALRESELMASFDHPNVIPIYEIDEDDGVFFIAMRFAGNGDLQGLLDRKGRLGLMRTLVIVEQVASALDAMHAALLVHWDVKLANILLGEGGHVYLADFGLARRVTSVDPRRDISRLADVAYRCLAGPRRSELAASKARSAPPPLSSVRPELPVAVSDLLAATTVPPSQVQYRSAGSLAHALRLAGLGAQSSRATLWAHLSDV